MSKKVKLKNVVAPLDPVNMPKAEPEPIRAVEQVEDPMAVKQQTVPAYVVKDFINKLPDDAGVRFINGGVLVKKSDVLRAEGLLPDKTPHGHECDCGMHDVIDAGEHYTYEERNGMTPDYVVPSGGKLIPLENVASLDFHSLPVCQRNTEELDWEADNLSSAHREMIDEFRQHDIDVANYCAEMVRRSILAANEYNTQKFAHMAGVHQGYVDNAVHFLEDVIDTVVKG